MPTIISVEGNIGSGILRFIARRRCNPGQNSTLPLEKHNFFFFTDSY